MCSASSGDRRAVRAPGDRRCRATRRRGPRCIDAGAASPRRRTTRTCSTLGLRSTASSVADFRSTGLPRRQPPSAVMSERGLGVVDAARQRLRREAAEDDRVGRADARAGQHGDGQLRDHGHVDGDAVAGPDPELEEGVGGLLDLAMEVGVGERPRVARLADPVVGDLVAEPGLDVTVEAVLRDVERAVLEPAGEGQLPGEGRGERLLPAQLLASELGPEGLEVLVGAGVEVRVRRWPAARTRGRGGNVRPSTMRFSISGPPPAGRCSSVTRHSSCADPPVARPRRRPGQGSPTSQPDERTSRPGRAAPVPSSLGLARLAAFTIAGLVTMLMTSMIPLACERGG